MSDFKPGDKVRVVSGPWETLEGSIKSPCVTVEKCWHVGDIGTHVMEEEMEKANTCPRCGDITWNCGCTEE